MKFSRYIRVSELCAFALRICYTSGLIDHAIQEPLFLDRIIDKNSLKFSFKDPAATYLPGPSPAKYCRPRQS